MAKTLTTVAVGGETKFATPASTGVGATATVNGGAATVSAQNTQGITLATPAAQNDVVAITYNPVTVNNTRDETYVPTEGGTVVVTQFCDTAFLNPAAALTNLTITFPPTPSKEGQEFRVLSSKAVSAVSWVGGNKWAAPGSLAAGIAVSFLWNISGNEWVRIN